MELIFIEVPACLFFYFTAVYDYLGKCTHLRQMDAQSICMASQGGIEEFGNGTIWARKLNWEKFFTRLGSATKKHMHGSLPSE